MPEHRKKRQHITAILSGNEINKENGTKLFKRIKHGHYLFNHNVILNNKDKYDHIYNVLNAPVFYDIFERKIKNPEYEAYELQRFIREIKGDLPGVPGGDSSPVSFKELQYAIEKKMSLHDAIFGRRVKRGHSIYNNEVEHGELLQEAIDSYNRKLK